jgi:hypothetical protein
MMREDLIRFAIQQLPGAQFERFARRLIRRALYPGLVPTSESHDLGQDAKSEETTRFLHQGRWVSLFASKTATLRNLRASCSRNSEEGNKIERVVFAIAETPRETTIKNWRRAIRKEFGWELEVRTLAFLTETAADPSYEGLVDEYLYVPPPGGDFVQDIEISFKKHTAKALQNVSVCIQGLVSPIQRDEKPSVEDQLMLGNGVLLTGEAGTGKSGIGLELVVSARQQNKGVLFIDCRQLGYVQNDAQLSQHFALKGSLDMAVKRLARYAANGVRVVIDQLDNTVGSRSAELLVDLAIVLKGGPRIEVVVISRNREGHEAKLVRKLQLARFAELTSHPLPDATAAGILRELGLTKPSKDLVELSTNLLNLSLVAAIRESQRAFDFSTVMDEVDLWESYVKALQEREAVGATFEQGEQVIAEAARLAKLGLNDTKRSFRLGYARTPAQRRLESSGLIHREDGDVFRFRHEKLQDFIFAWDAVRLRMMPVQVVGEICEIFRTRNVIRWMQRLYTKQAPRVAARFLKELAESDLPFYTRVSVLDDYISSPQVIRDAHLLREILRIIRTETTLRSYFFRSRPHPAWAHVLWQTGFFDEAPRPECLDDGRVSIPRWDVQDFLLSVAPRVPDVVLMHVEQVSAHVGYRPGAVRALSLIPGDLAETRLSTVAGWLDEDDIQALSGETLELIEKLLTQHRYDSALRLFAALAEPLPSKNAKRIEIESFSTFWTVNSEARSKLGSWGPRGHLSKLVSLFADGAPARFVAVLEGMLRSALRLEAEVEERPEAEFESTWRHAIENSGQNGVGNYKDHLLEALRDTLEGWCSREPTRARDVVERYVAERSGILRRLAFHILSRFAAQYKRLASGELKRPDNFSDIAIHHEFLHLLRHGYATLTAQDQKTVLGIVLHGPRLEELRGRLEAQGDEPQRVDAYLQGYGRRWTRDRLWMIKDQVDTEGANVLKIIVAEQGEPDHPDFLTWSSYSSGGFGTQEPYFQEGEIVSKSPEELVLFLRKWCPDQAASRLDRRPSFTDLARAVAVTMSQHLSTYAGVLREISLLRSELANALVGQLLGADEPQLEQWEAGLNLSEQLLYDDVLLAHAGRLGDVSWVDVRRSIARALAMHLERASRELERIDRYFSPDKLTRTRRLLLKLLSDPDDGGAGDELAESSATGGDPIAASLRHVRPTALEALIDCELCRLFRSPDFSERFGTSRLDPVVGGALAGHLDTRCDRGHSIHVVLGSRLIDLAWLDEAWTLRHLDLIFPDGNSSQEVSKFAAAFNSFAWAKRSRIYPVLFDALRPKYVRAIRNLRDNPVASKDNFAGEGLSAQLLWDFLYGEYELVSSTGDESLIADFLRNSPARYRSHTAWLLWEILRQCQGECQTELSAQLWRRTRLLWEWRVAEASRLNHPTDLDSEMEWYCHFALLAPAGETLASLWPLLEGLLPHLSGPGGGHLGWDEMERYLSIQVQRDRVRATRMYRLMHQQYRNPGLFAFRYENEQKILETALEFEDSRADALAVINIIASKGGSDRHRDLFERYAG